MIALDHMRPALLLPPLVMRRVERPFSLPDTDDHRHADSRRHRLLRAMAGCDATAFPRLPRPVRRPRR